MRKASRKEILHFAIMRRLLNAERDLREAKELLEVQGEPNLPGLVFHAHKRVVRVITFYCKK